jgi:hypothetical protein
MFEKAVDKRFDKLPSWAKVTCATLTIVGSVYCIARFGFFHFLLRVFLSP